MTEAFPVGLGRPRTGSIRKKNFQIDTDQILVDEMARTPPIEAPTLRDHNNTHEIEDLRCERMPERSDKQNYHQALLKVIILGDTGKFIFDWPLNCPCPTSAH